MEDEKDRLLWKIAKKRVEFKRNLFNYLVVNLFLWTIWFFSGDGNWRYNHIPWPAWVSLGWGVGIIFKYYEAYIAPRNGDVEQEYEKLKRERESSDFF